MTEQLDISVIYQIAVLSWRVIRLASDRTNRYKLTMISRSSTD